jgi:hypothetical protein
MYRLPEFSFPPKLRQLKKHERHDKQYANAPGATKNRGWTTKAQGDPTKQEESNHRHGYPLIEPKIKQVDRKSKHKADRHYQLIR